MCVQMLTVNSDLRMYLEDYTYVSMDLSRSELLVLWPDSRDEYKGRDFPDFEDGGVSHLIRAPSLTLAQPDRQALHHPWQSLAQRCCAPRLVGAAGTPGGAHACRCQFMADQACRVPACPAVRRILVCRCLVPEEGWGACEGHSCGRRGLV